MSLRYGYFDSEISGYDEEGMPIFDRAESSDFLAMLFQKLLAMVSWQIRQTVSR